MAQEMLSIDVRASDEQKAQIFTLRGSLDIATAPTVRAALLEAAEHGNHEIVVDLSQIEFIDSTGLGALIGGQRRARESGGEVRLVATEGQILRLLRITGLIDKVFAVYPTVAAALSDGERVSGL